MSLSNLYIHSVTIKRKTVVVDNYLGAEETKTAVGPTVRGRMVPLSGHELLLAMQLNTNVSHHFYCAPGVRVKEEDELTFGGKIFRVQSIVEPDRMNRFKKLLLEERRGEGI